MFRMALHECTVLHLFLRNRLNMSWSSFEDLSHGSGCSEQRDTSLLSSRVVSGRWGLIQDPPKKQDADH